MFGAEHGRRVTCRRGSAGRGKAGVRLRSGPRGAKVLPCGIDGAGHGLAAICPVREAPLGATSAVVSREVGRGQGAVLGGGRQRAASRAP